jgi:hypothetical protein
LKATRVRNTPRNEFLHWLKDYEKNVQKREEKRLETIRMMHNENKSIMEKLLEKFNK